MDVKIDGITEEISLVITTKEIKYISIIKKIIYFTIKKIFDVVCSLIAVVFLVPLSIFIKIAYLLTGDTAPIIFTQKRIGKNGKEFNFYKYRTMVPDADKKLEELMASDKKIKEEYELNKKLKHDPRVTTMGNLLRKTSLDEFPQFINVLKGDMSIIGNRPYLPREKEDMGIYFNDIVKTKCGIVSYWAVMGRSDVSFQTRLRLERYYSNFQSLSLDIKIFLRVFRVVVLRKGAK